MSTVNRALWLILPTDISSHIDMTVSEGRGDDETQDICYLVFTRKLLVHVYISHSTVRSETLGQFTWHKFLHQTVNFGLSFTQQQHAGTPETTNF